MLPGRELDALIAEKVMGWKKIHFTAEMNLPWQAKALGLTWMWDKKEGCLVEESQMCPKYSTDIAAAWEVVEKIGRNGNNDFEVGRTEPGGKLIYCAFGIWDGSKYKDYSYKSDTAPHAICLAALKAVGVKV